LQKSRFQPEDARIQEKNAEARLFLFWKKRNYQAREMRSLCPEGKSRPLRQDNLVSDKTYMIQDIMSTYECFAFSHPFINAFGIFFISVALTHFILTPFFNWIQERISKKPHLIFNVTEVENIKNGGHLENFKLLFGTRSGRSTLLAAQTGDKGLNKSYGEVATPIERIPCDNCTEYSFSVKNTGKKSAKNIVIDLQALSDIKLIENEKDPKINHISCGGMLHNKGCRLLVNLLKEDDSLFFTAVAEQKPGIRNVSCLIDGETKNCEINFRHYYVQEVFPNMHFEMDGEVIQLPPFNNTDVFIQYHWKPQTKEWVQDLS